MEHSLKKMRAFLPAGFLHRIPCLFHVLTIHGMCPTNRRQWADSLASLAALLHRQYKTARTELVVISYSKQGRWRLRQRLRAVMFYSAVPQGTHENPKIVCGLRTHPWSAQNLEKHGSSQMQNPTGVEMPHFLIRISSYISIWNRKAWSVFHYSTYHVKRDCPLMRQSLLL